MNSAKDQGSVVAQRAETTVNARSLMACVSELRDPHTMHGQLTPPTQTSGKGVCVLS